MDPDIRDFRDTRDRADLVQRWKQQFATTVYHRWKSRRFGSADAFKEDESQCGGYYERGDHGRHAAKMDRDTGNGDALEERRRELRAKFRFPEWLHLEGGPYWGTRIERPNTYTGMFTN